MAYPSSEHPPLPTSPLPDIQGAPTGVIQVTLNSDTVAMHIDPNTASYEVVTTLRAAFHLPHDSRIILKRATDGAIVVPSANLQSGSYVLEEVHPEWKKSYKRLREQHLPAAQKHFKEVIAPSLVGASQAAGKQIATAGNAVKSHATVAASHTSNFLSTTGTAVKGHVERSTRIANNHATANSQTWTAKLWVSICSCAPGPVSFFTGVPVEELPKKDPPPPGSSESVPVSSNAA